MRKSVGLANLRGPKIQYIIGIDEHFWPRCRQRGPAAERLIARGGPCGVVCVLGRAGARDAV